MVSPGAWIEIDTDALARNARVLAAALPDDAQLGILVKANAYGHGLLIGARAAVAGGAERLIVATLDEGLALRADGISLPILVAYPVPPDGIGDAVAADLELTGSGVESVRCTLEAWRRSRRALGDRLLRLHAEVDTGMGRGGVWLDALDDVVAAIEAEPATALVAVWSHLAEGADPDRSADQARRFDAAVERLTASGRGGPFRHLVATEGLFVATAPVYEMARIGLAFYGELGIDVKPAPAMAAAAAELQPAMTVKARPLRVERLPAGASVGYGSEWIAKRDSLIATIPIGYADGWSRSSWPGAGILIRGRRVPLVGRVSMDAVCADVTDLGAVEPDEEVVLLGAQGDERITVDELARLCRTIPNEVLCGFGPRLPRLPVAAAPAN